MTGPEAFYFTGMRIVGILTQADVDLTGLPIEYYFVNLNMPTNTGLGYQKAINFHTSYTYTRNFNASAKFKPDLDPPIPSLTQVYSSQKISDQNTYSPTETDTGETWFGYIVWRASAIMDRICFLGPNTSTTIVPVPEDALRIVDSYVDAQKISKTNGTSLVGWTEITSAGAGHIHSKLYKVFRNFESGVGNDMHIMNKHGYELMIYKPLGWVKYIKNGSTR